MNRTAYSQETCVVFLVFKSLKDQHTVNFHIVSRHTALQKRPPSFEMLLFCHEYFLGQDVTSFPPFVWGRMRMMLFQQYTLPYTPRCSLT